MVRFEFRLAPAFPIQSLTLGVVTEITPSQPNVVTDNPVEDGVRRTDHSRKKNATLRVGAYLADDLRIESGTDLFRNSGAPAVPLETGQAVVEFLQRLQSDAIPVSVVSEKFFAPSMLITSVLAPRTLEGGRGYRTTVELVEFVTVTTATAVVPRIRLAANKKDIGPVSTTTANAATVDKTKRVSLLAGSVDLLRKAFK